MSQRAPSFLVEIAYNLLRAKQQADLLITSQPVVLPTNTSFKMIILRIYIKSLGNCKVVITRSIRKRISPIDFVESWCEPAMQRSTAAVHYTGRAGLSCFKSGLNFSGNDEITFHPERGIAISRAAFPSMATECLQTCYREEKKEVIGSRDSGNVWLEKSDRNAESFAGFFSYYLR